MWSLFTQTNDFSSQQWKKNAIVRWSEWYLCILILIPKLKFLCWMEKNFTFSEEEIYKIFVRKRSNKVWWVELCGIILLGSEWFLENYGIHSCEISYCPRIEIFVHKYRSRVVPRTEKKMMIKFIYSEKATKFCEISTLLLTGTT